MKVMAVLLMVGALTVHAEDWTTLDGKTYKGVTVLSHDDGYVTILDSDGGAKIMLSELPATLRARFNFDPARASACVAATEKSDQADRVALEKEADAADATAQAKLKTESPQPMAVAVVPAPAAASAARTTGLTPDQRQAIQDQITALQQDIQMMQGELAKTHDHTSAGGYYQGTQTSHGAYQDKIVEDQQQIRELQAQLAGGAAPASASTQQGGLGTGVSGSAFSNVPRL